MSDKSKAIIEKIREQKRIGDESRIAMHQLLRQGVPQSDERVVELNRQRVQAANKLSRLHSQYHRQRKADDAQEASS